MAKKKVKKKIKFAGILVIILALYLIIMLGYYIFTMPIKTIIINGNKILDDNMIITTAGIDGYPPLFKTSKNSIKKRISSLDLVENVEIKKKINGTLTIDITEEKVLFYNKSSEKYALSNQKEVELYKELIGVPTLVNYTPSDIYEDLVKKMSKIDSDIISLISEIEYRPDIKGDVIIDEYRFYLRMNDGNRAYINIANFDRLQEYKELYKTVDSEEKGTFYLDVIYSNSNGISFVADGFNLEENSEEEENELSE